MFRPWGRNLISLKIKFLLLMAFYVGKGECKHSCQIRDLQLWRRFHETPFFNPGRIVTEKEVNEILHAYPKSATTSYQRPWGRTDQYWDVYHQLLFKDKFKENASQTDMAKSPSVRDAFKYSRAFSTSPSSGVARPRIPDEPRSRTADDKRGGSARKSSRCMLRKPIVDNRTLSCSPTKTHGDQEGPLTEQMRPYSYTTLDDPHPHTPLSIYATSYPLLLQQIPKRPYRDEDPCTEEEDLFETQSLRLQQPRFSMTYFNTVPNRLTRELSWDKIEFDEIEEQ